jgi:hypothetical protein
MRLNGVEPSRVFPPTRPSTLRVYQFRHSRGRTAILDGRAVGRGWLGEAAPCGYPGQAIGFSNRCSNALAPGMEE